MDLRTFNLYLTSFFR